MTESRYALVAVDGDALTPVPLPLELPEACAAYRLERGEALSRLGIKPR